MKLPKYKSNYTEIKSKIRFALGKIILTPMHSYRHELTTRALISFAQTGKTFRGSNC